MGYANKIARKLYHFVHPNTNRMITSGDVKWLSRRYGVERNVKFVPTKWDDISDDEENGNDEQTTNDKNIERSASNNESEDEEKSMTSMPIGTPIKPKLELQRLDIG